MALPLGNYAGYAPGDDPDWELAFEQEHGYPPTVNQWVLQDALNARGFGESFMGMYGHAPSMDDYRYNFFSARGMGPTATRGPGYISAAWKPIRF